jgi:hypothetical protein
VPSLSYSDKTGDSGSNEFVYSAAVVPSLHPICCIGNGSNFAYSVSLMTNSSHTTPNSVGSSLSAVSCWIDCTLCCGYSSPQGVGVKASAVNEASPAKVRDGDKARQTRHRSAFSPLQKGHKDGE